MNYIRQLNAFWSWRRQHTLPATALALWYTLTSEQNAEMWVKALPLPTDLLRHWLGDVSRAAFVGARDRLVSEGLLTLHKGKRGITVYQLAKLYKEPRKKQPDTKAAKDAPTGEENEPLKTSDAAKNKPGIEDPKPKPKRKTKTKTINETGGKHTGEHHGGVDPCQTGGNAKPMGKTKGADGAHRVDWQLEEGQEL